MNTTALLNRLIEGNDLTTAQAGEFLSALMEGGVPAAQAGAILAALRIKGETAEEIRGFVSAMRARMIPVKAPGAMDIVGTGGDGAGTFNVSTAAAFVAAGAGVKIAKHGNRAASSKCGSADVLEALGVNIALTRDQAAAVFKSAGIVFLLALSYHPAMKQVGSVRRELGVRTVFNILGPFANPAGTRRQLVGVPNLDIAKRVAQAARKLGYEHLLIVTSADGMDEVSTSAKTHVFEIRGTKVKRYTIDPAKLGFRKASKQALQGGDKEQNAAIIREILGGMKGPKRDIVVLNSACALYVAGAVKSIADGIVKAETSINSGGAAHALADLVRESQKYAL